jgi:hypothetical protein
MSFSLITFKNKILYENKYLRAHFFVVVVVVFFLLLFKAGEGEIPRAHSIKKDCKNHEFCAH